MAAQEKQKEMSVLNQEQITPLKEIQNLTPHTPKRKREEAPEADEDPWLKLKKAKDLQIKQEEKAAADTRAAYVFLRPKLEHFRDSSERSERTIRPIDYRQPLPVNTLGSLVPPNGLLPPSYVMNPHVIAPRAVFLGNGQTTSTANSRNNTQTSAQEPRQNGLGGN